MSDDTQKQLIKLRDQIIDTAMPLVAEGDLSAEQKFLLYMTAARTHANLSFFTKAYETALSFTDDSLKVDSLMQIAEEIDMALEKASDNDIETEEDQVQPDSQETTSENEENNQ